jgi:hypothetical protein
MAAFLSYSAGAAPLVLPFADLESSTFTQMTNQIASAGPVSPMSSTGTRFYRGAFSPGSTNARLAIRSDDGSDVSVNGVKIVSKKGTGTHWEDLASSLTVLDYAFTNAGEYCVEIDYENLAFTAGDTDGVSLYAFDGGGSVRDGIAVWGADFLSVGCSATLSTCGDPSISWTSSATSVVSVSGSGASVTVQGLAPGTASIMATDGSGKTGSRQITVIKLGIAPPVSAVCEGAPATLVVTNAEVTGGVEWSVSDTVSANTRTNAVAFAGSGARIVIATWKGCTALATVTVVRAAVLIPTSSHLCGAGSVTYSAATAPAGYESLLTWTGDGLTFVSDYQRIASYGSPGVQVVTISCGVSSVSRTVTVHKVDITNNAAYGLAGSPAPVTFSLSADSVGPFTWQASGGPSITGPNNGTSVSVLPGSTPGLHLVSAWATPLPSCNHTTTLQVVQVTFSSASAAFCEGASTNLSFTVDPPSALGLVTFDTVTNTTAGPSNTHATITIQNGTNLVVTGTSAGTAWVRARLGGTHLIGPALTIVRVTFPPEPWYVGVGKSVTNFVTLIPTNAPVTFDTVSNAIATAEAVAGGVKLTGVAPGTTQVRARVGAGMVCATKDVTAVRVKFATNAVTVCNGNSASVGVLIEPPGAPVTFVPSSSNLLQVSVAGTNVGVTASTNGAASVNAKVGPSVIDTLLVRSLTVRFPSNPWYAAPGGVQPFTVLVDPPEFAPFIGFMSSDPSIATVIAGCAPPCVRVFGVTNGTADIRATVNGTNLACASKPVNIVTPAIASVQWLNLDGSPITNMNPNPGGGLQVFPDSPLPATPPANQVRIRAIVTPAVAFSNGVYFRVFDVDDPYTNAPPIDNEQTGPDNRGALNQVSGAPFSTDTNGMAEAVFTLSMNPGDNFRVVAVTASGGFNGLAALQNDGLNARVVTNATGTPVPANHVSPLLTVWRRLHVGVDSMGTVPSGSNLVAGQVTSIQGSPGNLATQVNVNVNLAAVDASTNLDSGGNGRFENGDFLIGTNSPPTRTFGILGNGATYFRVRTNQSFNIPFTLSNGTNAASGQVWNMANTGSNTLFGVSTSLAPHAFDGGTIVVAGQAFGVLVNGVNTVALSNANATLAFAAVDDDDIGLLPRGHNLGILSAALADAYVHVLDDGGGDLSFNELNRPFLSNVSFLGQNTIETAFNKQASGSDSYWVGYLLISYQGPQDSDHDPNMPGENGTGGVAWSQVSNSTDEDGGNGAQIFIETVRDRLAAGALPGLEDRVSAHELGHQLGLDHWDLNPNTGLPLPGVTDPAPPPNLMSLSVQSVSNSAARFVPQHVHLLRRRTSNPGP